MENTFSGQILCSGAKHPFLHKTKGPGRKPSPPPPPPAAGVRAPPPVCDIPSGRRFFTGPWTVTRSPLRMLHRVAALRPVCLLGSLLRSRSPVGGTPPPSGRAILRSPPPTSHGPWSVAPAIPHSNAPPNTNIPRTGGPQHRHRPREERWGAASDPQNEGPGPLSALSIASTTARATVTRRTAIGRPTAGGPAPL